MFEFLSFIAEWINSTIYTFVTDAITYLFSTFFILWLKVQLFGLEFAWDIAKGVMQTIGANTALHNAWGMLPSDVAAAANFFKVPDSINLLITAGVTRLVLSFLPFA
ncbi:MAG: hypothetical protein H6R15_193 [Proteobacteria bacterium]|nr:hypothetical protein [Pseudomonadota bacterium]